LSYAPSWVDFSDKLLAHTVTALREGEQLPHTNQNMPVGTKGSRPYLRIYKEED